MPPKGMPEMSPSEVRAARAALGMTQAQLAAALAVTVRAVRYWEQDGTAKPCKGLPAVALRLLLEKMQPRKET